MLLVEIRYDCMNTIICGFLWHHNNNNRIIVVKNVCYFRSDFSSVSVSFVVSWSVVAPSDVAAASNCPNSDNLILAYASL